MNSRPRRSFYVYKSQLVELFCMHERDCMNETPPITLTPINIGNMKENYIISL